MNRNNSRMQALIPLKLETLNQSPPPKVAVRKYFLEKL